MSTMTAFNKAWDFLKALPEQQMFVERTPRTNAGYEGYEEYDDYPEIDRYGARSLGTVHPAIMGMLARNKNEHFQPLNFPPNLNLDKGREDDARIAEDERAAKRGLSSGRLGHFSSPLYGRSIAQGPEYNMSAYDAKHYDDRVPIEGYNLSGPTINGEHPIHHVMRERYG
jgi:hypothetical protein